MTHSLLIRPEAEEDLRQSFRWYEAQRSGLGKDFLMCVEAGLDAVRENPFQFPVLYKEVRRGLVRRFPFAVFYVVQERTVSVLAVLHCRRHPKTWQKRF